MLYSGVKLGRALAYAALIIAFGSGISSHVDAQTSPNPPSVTIQLPKRICPGDGIWLYTKPNGQIRQYEWSVDGKREKLSAYDLQDVKYLAPEIESNVDDVTVTVIDAFGNSASHTVRLTVQKCNCSDQDSRIVYPEPSQPVSGLLTIRGTARHESFKFYKLEFAQGRPPNDIEYRWHKDSLVFTQVDHNVLGEWDTTGWPDGDYTLRLTVAGGPNNDYKDQCKVPITLRNTGVTSTPTSPSATTTNTVAPAPCSDVRSRIAYPRPGQSVAGSLEITGNADHERFKFYKLEFALKSNDPPKWEWPVDSTIDIPVRDGPLGTWNTSGWPDGLYTLRLTVVDLDSQELPPCLVDIVVNNTAPTPVPSAPPAPTASQVVAVGASAVPENRPAASPLPIVSQEVTLGARLRSGPGQNFSIVGSVLAGESLLIIGRNVDSTWFRLANGDWISAVLVEGAPADIPVVQAAGDASATAGVAVTVQGDANLRRGPGVCYERVGGAAEGQLLSAIARIQDGSWYQLGDGNWIVGSALVNPPLDLPVVAVVIDSAALPTVLTSADLRAGPGDQYQSLGLASAGDVVTITGRNANCTWFLLADNRGWLAASYIKNAPPDIAIAADNSLLTQ